MNTIEHNIVEERRFVDFLGYSLVGPNNSNRWIILDGEKQVGYIQYKKLYNGNKKKGLLKTFGYEMHIDSKDIECNNIRRIEKEDKHNIKYDYAHYSFDIKRANDSKDLVSMNVGWSPSLTIWSKQYGYISFQIDYQGMYLNYKSKTDNFNIEEVLIYHNVDDLEHHNNKEYCYQIRYCDKDHELSDDNPKGRTTREISGTQRYYDKNQLKISEKTWVDGELRTNRDSIVEGTVEEMATKHQMGIDCFNHFRYLLNKIIPFNDDVVSLIINDDNIKEGNVGIFFQDNEKEEELIKKLKQE